MTHVVVRGFFSRKLRAVLTGIAIALGVALMSGTYILTDTINRSFATIFATGAQGRSVVVVPHQGLGANAQVQTATISEATLAKVRAVPGVAVASGEVFSIASLFDAHGKRLNKRAPSFVASTLPARFENFSAVSGTLPTRATDVAIDQATAQRYSLTVGQALRVAGATAAATYRIAGIVKFAGSASFGGAGVALVTPAQAQRIAGEPGAFDTLVIAAAPSVSDSALRARIRAVLPASLDVRTGVQQAAKQTSDLESQLGFLRTFLLIFAYVSLFVGAFIIFNTFSITVAQRTREFGLLRTLGATRGQIVRSVVAEGAMLGLGGAVGRPAGRVRARPGSRSAVQGVRCRSARQRHGGRVPHGLGVAARGHRGDGARRPAAGAARRARDADRGDARGCRSSIECAGGAGERSSWC